MPEKKRYGREIGGLVLLFVIFLASAVYYERKAQEATSRSAPSSFNAAKQGAKALYLLLERQKYPAARMETPWDGLRSRMGLLVLIEPFDRGVSPEEITALRRWVEGGGTTLYLVTEPARPLDPQDTVFGDVEVVDGSAEPKEVAPRVANSYTQDVQKMRFATGVRLQPEPEAGYTTLFADEEGALALTKPLGKGHLVMLASSAAATNAAIQEADNAVFLVNVASAAVGTSEKTIVFDEYHHGVGFARSDSKAEGMWRYTPFPLQLAFWHLCALGLLLLYNGNRRLGRSPVPTFAAPRARGDYLGALARFYHRANAADAALQTLYQSFLRALARQTGAPPEAPSERLFQQVERQHNVDVAALRRLMARCEQVIAGQRISEREMLELARQIEDFRRRCHLVGTQ